jgi:hypothetical protein
MRTIIRPVWRAAVPLVALLLAVAVRGEPAQESPLAAEDRRLLEGLLADFLFDPRGAERVSVKFDLDGGRSKKREGWLVAGKDGKPGRVFFTDGESIPAPPEKDIAKVDFVAGCRAWLNEAGAAGTPESPRAHREQVLEQVGGANEMSDLVLAAWLHRLGHDDLAARVLTLAREANDSAEELRGRLASAANQSMVSAYREGAFDEALEHGRRLLRLYPKEAEKSTQARAVVAEVRRRQKSGRAGRQPPKLPDGFQTWKADQKLAYLLDNLDEVCKQESALAAIVGDPALIALAEPAVPKLIDMVEGDERLTRSVDWVEHVVSVRETALATVLEILDVAYLDPTAAEQENAAHNKEAARRTAARLRAYWKKYGGMPYDERMMKVLTDPQANVGALHEAARNLVWPDDGRIFGLHSTMTFQSGRPRGIPAVDKFRRPSAAEAILAAMDRHLADDEAQPPEKRDEDRRCKLEDGYLDLLADLGDARILPALRQRCRLAPTPRLRRKWASVCRKLGDAGPLKAFARDFQAGNVLLPIHKIEKVDEWERPAARELKCIMEDLACARMPEADRALLALTHADHPAHALAVRLVLEGAPRLAHPCRLCFLRQALDDATPTGWVYQIEDGHVYGHRESLRISSTSGCKVPAILADPAKRRDKAAECGGDAAAAQLSASVLGMPEYHVLLRDADRRRQAIKVKETCDRFRESFRLLRLEERQALDCEWEIAFMPDMPPLGRPATEFDVRAGKAIFHLDGKGQLADLKLPAAGTLKSGDKKEGEKRVLIVQAEVGPDGEVLYGIIGKGQIRMAREKEMAAVAPLVPHRPEVKPES